MAKLLFICSANLDRSPGAAAFFSKSKSYEAKSAGLHLLSRTHLSRQAVEWADYIFVMDEATDKHKTMLMRKFPEARKKEIIVLDVPNGHMRNSPDLFHLMKKKIIGWLLKKRDNIEAKRVERVRFEDWRE